MRSLARLFVALTAAVALFNFLPLGSWYFQEVARNFSLYELIALLIGVVLLALNRSLYARRVRALMIALLLTLALDRISYVYPFYVAAGSAVSVSERSVKILYANLHVGNRQYEKFVEIVKREEPDILGLLEYSGDWDRVLSSELTSLRHRIQVEFDPDTFALALYANRPFVGEPKITTGDESELPPVIITGIGLKDGPEVTFALMHAVPPVGTWAMSSNRRVVRRVATDLRESGGNLIVATDLNATPFSPSYERLKRGAYLRHAGEGYGMQATWYPLREVPLGLQIDHVFYRGALTVKDFRVLEDFGSDHRPIVAEFNY